MKPIKRKMFDLHPKTGSGLDAAGFADSIEALLSLSEYDLLEPGVESRFPPWRQGWPASIEISNDLQKES